MRQNEFYSFNKSRRLSWHTQVSFIKYHNLSNAQSNTPLQSHRKKCAHVLRWLYLLWLFCWSTFCFRCNSVQFSFHKNSNIESFSAKNTNAADFRLNCFLVYWIYHIVHRTAVSWKKKCSRECTFLRIWIYLVIIINSCFRPTDTHKIRPLRAFCINLTAIYYDYTSHGIDLLAIYWHFQ